MNRSLPNFGVILQEIKLKGYSDFTITNSQAARAFNNRDDAYERFSRRLVAAMEYWGLKLGRVPTVYEDRRIFRVTRRPPNGEQPRRASRTQAAPRRRSDLRHPA